MLIDLGASCCSVNRTAFTAICFSRPGQFLLLCLQGRIHSNVCFSTWILYVALLTGSRSHRYVLTGLDTFCYSVSRTVFIKASAYWHENNFYRHQGMATSSHKVLYQAIIMLSTKLNMCQHTHFINILVFRVGFAVWMIDSCVNFLCARQFSTYTQ
jgi:hypothetical protein